jgi:hypothetical protein
VGVFLGKMICPPTPTIGVCDGLVAPQNSVRTESGTGVQEEADGAPINQKAYLGLQKQEGSCREGSPKVPSIICCQPYEVGTGARV